MSGTQQEVEKGSVSPKEIFLGEIKSRSVFPSWILHMVSRQPEYENSIIRGIREMTSGVMSVSPNAPLPHHRPERRGEVRGDIRLTPANELQEVS